MLRNKKIKKIGNTFISWSNLGQTIIILCLLSDFQTFLGNYCYQCADSKTDGSCQTSLKTMARASYYIKNPPTSDDDTYEKKKDLYNLFVKNCTAYQQNLNYTLCVIETFEYRGKRRVYLFAQHHVHLQLLEFF